MKGTGKRYYIWRRGFRILHTLYSLIYGNSIRLHYGISASCQGDLYFTANDVPEAKQVPILLSSIGAPTYALLRDLLAPGAPGTKSLAEISATLTQHFEPKRAVIAERFTNGTSQWEKVLLNLMRFYVTSPHVVILGSFFTKPYATDLCAVGSRFDPTAVIVGDLYQSSGDSKGHGSC